MYYDYSESDQGVGLSLYSNQGMFNKAVFRTTTFRLKSTAAPAFAMAGAPGPVMQEAALDSDRVAYTTTAGSRGGPPKASKPIEIRTEFPETWLFDNLEFGEK